MKQLNIKITPEFDSLINQAMQRRKIKKKTALLYQLVKEAAEQDLSVLDTMNRLELLLGKGLKTELNPNPRFTKDDDLWS